MPAVRIEEHEKGIRVSSETWVIEHLANAGGTWSSLLFSGRELLRGPAGGSLRFVESASGAPTGIFTSYSEFNERTPRLRAETSAAGVVSVIAEGTFRDAAGIAIPVGYRRRTEYHAHGLIWTTLEIMSESGCDNVVDVRALEMALHPNWQQCFVRFHPTQAGGADLLGGRGTYPLGGNTAATAFVSRFTPLQVSLRGTHGTGIDFFPGSDLAQWDTTFKPDAGLGCYRVARDAAGISLEFSPYCMAFRRLRTKVIGAPALRMGIALPTRTPNHPTAPARISRPETSDAELSALALQGVKLLHYCDSFRDEGAFWRHGEYPPYDEAGMRELKRVVDTAHRLGMKIVPTISLKELHPAAPAFAQNARAWMHQASPSLDVIHNWTGSGESGALMCLKSGWFDYLKNHVDTVLAALPWDGLFLESATTHPCCHPQHGRGAHHSDAEQVLEFLAYARTRVGTGILGVDVAGSPSIFAENISDL